MATQQTRKYCTSCGKSTLHQRETFSGGMGCLLSIVTGGLFIPVWIGLAILDGLRSYRCQNCGQSN